MSRYRSVPTIFDKHYKRKVRGIRTRPAVDQTLTFTVMLNADETFETLAYRHYGAENLWWVIADQNPLLHPLFLVAGTYIRILKKSHLPDGRLPVRYGV